MVCAVTHVYNYMVKERLCESISLHKIVSLSPKSNYVLHQMMYCIYIKHCSVDDHTKALYQYSTHPSVGEVQAPRDSYKPGSQP